MKALLIGGTGTISLAITTLLSQNLEWEVWILNRGHSSAKLPANIHQVTVDIHNPAEIEKAISLLPEKFDTVADFIAYNVQDVKRDLQLFANRTNQYIFISSASIYQKPPVLFPINESTPLSNPYWDYSRQKIEAEEFLIHAYQNQGFPVTIVRPSHTYGTSSVPVALHGKKGSWQVIYRMLHRKPVIIPGDGNTLWTITYNMDFAKGFVGLMANPRALGQAVHITGDECLTWNQIYNIIANTLGVPLIERHVSTDFLTAADPSLAGPLLGDKSNNAIFDNHKIKKLVPDFLPTTRFDQGIQHTLQHIMKTPSLQILDPEFDLFCDHVVKIQDEALQKIQNYGHLNR